MNDYQEVFGKLETAIEGIESLKKSAYKQYSILVDAVINNRITEQKEIERISKLLVIKQQTTAPVQNQNYI